MMKHRMNCGVKFGCNQEGPRCRRMEFRGKQKVGSGCNGRWIWHQDNRFLDGSSSPQVWRSVSPSCRECRVPYVQGTVLLYFRDCNGLNR